MKCHSKLWMDVYYDIYLIICNYQNNIRLNILELQNLSFRNFLIKF
jgi:hypothetical protein